MSDNAGRQPDPDYAETAQLVWMELAQQGLTRSRATFAGWMQDVHPELSLGQCVALRYFAEAMEGDAR